jgi:hypothetical protein
MAFRVIAGDVAARLAPSLRAHAFCRPASCGWLLRLRRSAESSASTTGRMVIEIGKDRGVIVDADVDPATLARVLAILGSDCPPTPSGLTAVASCGPRRGWRSSIPALIYNGVGLKCSPKLGQPELEFSGVMLMPAGAPMSHSTAISAPCCRSRYGAGLRCSLYAESRRGARK